MGGKPEAILNSEGTFLLWLNAHEYRRDEDGRRALEQLHALLPFEWLRGVFVSMMIDRSRAKSGEIARPVVSLKRAFFSRIVIAGIEIHRHLPRTTNGVIGQRANDWARPRVAWHGIALTAVDADHPQLRRILPKFYSVCSAMTGSIRAARRAGR